jgi:CCR4-NOT transcriptional regulation complex NOT5 subunit
MLSISINGMGRIASSSSLTVATTAAGFTLADDPVDDEVGSFPSWETKTGPAPTSDMINLKKKSIEEERRRVRHNRNDRSDQRENGAMVVDCYSFLSKKLQTRHVNYRTHIVR